MTLDESCDLRRQIIEDILGDSVEEYENFKRDETESKDSKRQHRQRIPLWRFLLHLLNRDKSGRLIEWSPGKPLQFRIKNTIGVASLWGSVKDKDDMTYEKLGRAMRYYYGKNIIEKVSGRRYSYQFILSRRTAKHLSQFVDVKKIKMDEDEHGVKSLETNDVEYITSTHKREEKSESLINVIEEEFCGQNYEKMKPVKPQPHQAASKTKIFKPNELLLSRLFESKSQISLPLEDNRRSAFVAPVKRASTVEEIYKKMPRLERISNFTSKYCSSDRDKIQGGGPTLSPYFVRFANSSINGQQFAFREEARKDLVVREDIVKFRTTRRIDPFMGAVDYIRHDDENERRNERLLYDDVEDSSYTHRQHLLSVDM